MFLRSRSSKKFSSYISQLRAIFLINIHYLLYRVSASYENEYEWDSDEKYERKLRIYDN